MVDLSESRLEAAKKFGATHTICSSDIAEIKAFINEVTEGRGVDISMECVGYPATFDVCQNVISVGGHIANVGVHGKPVSFNLDDLWIKNITLNTGLVNANTTEMLLNVLKSGKIDATKLITHHFKLSEVEKRPMMSLNMRVKTMLSRLLSKMISVNDKCLSIMFQKRWLSSLRFFRALLGPRDPILVPFSTPNSP